MDQDQHAEISKKNARIGLTILTVVIGMGALSYAFVPLYNLFCRVTGFGGTTQTAETLPDEIINRTVTIKFNAQTNKNLPWDFKPEQREITVKLGQRGITSYTAYNKENKPTAPSPTTTHLTSRGWDIMYNRYKLQKQKKEKNSKRKIQSNLSHKNKKLLKQNKQQQHI